MNEENNNDILLPEYDEFLEKLYSISPIGNAQACYDEMSNHLGKQLPTRDILTFELLVKRYKDYNTYIDPFNNIKDKQYIKKDKKKVDLLFYLIDRMYINDYSSQLYDSNDEYLFGI